MIRRNAVGLAALIYALFSSPTPDAPGIPEYIIIALIAFAALPLKFTRESWTKPLAVLMAYGFTVPLVMGALSGNAGGDIIRDLIAFAALGLPLFLAHLYPDEQTAQKHLLFTLLGIGLIFSARYLASTFSQGVLSLDHDLLYLANSPLVAFAAGWLLLRGCFVEPKPGRALGLTLLSLIPIVAMAAMMQRATIILLALVWFAFFASNLIKNPRRAIVLIIGASALLILVWPLPEYIFDALADKTMNVGWNARGAEFAALFDTVSANPLTAIFGDGWGSLLKSPAVGDMWVRFSHALLSSLLWKTGALGLLIGIMVMGGLVMAAIRRLRPDLATLAALLMPLLPALFLYGSYKSLCFGLLLLGIARLSWTNRRME